MRALLLAAIALVALAGCTETPDAIPTQPDALLVRVFLEDGDAVVRFAATTGTTVHPFHGDVELLLVPEESTGWLPQAWTGRVWPHQFHDAELPYYEVIRPVNEARPGDSVRVEAEAQLPDGQIIRGHYTTWF